MEKRNMGKGIPGLAGRIFLLLFSSIYLFLTPEVNADVYGSISGKVIAEDTGEGIANIGICLAGQLSCSRWTDKHGAYTVEGLNPGKYKIYFSTLGSRYIKEKKPVEVLLLKGKNRVNVNYVLKLGGAVSGTVYDADGMSPLSKVWISADVPNPQPELIDGFRSIITNSNGKFLLQGLPESDTCIVKVDIRGYAGSTRTVKITKGRVTEDIDFVLKKEAATGITGHIISSIDNQPIINAKIVLINSSGKDMGNTYTNEQGKYLITGLVPGRYKAVVSWPMAKTDSIYKNNITINNGKQAVVDFYLNAPVSTVQPGN